MESDAIVREANQKRQQIRQSILRLLDRREEIIGGMKSYLEMAQESLQHFSRDDASLFSLPKEDTGYSGEQEERRKQESAATKKTFSAKRRTAGTAGCRKS